MQIEYWTEQDIDAIAQAESLIFKTPWTRSMLAEAFESPIFVMYTVKEDGGLTAYGGYYRVGDELHIANLAVMPQHRRRGAAKLLIERILADAAGLNSAGITLEVRASNIAAITLYGAYGFRIGGLRKKYYENTEDAYIMWKYLDR